MTATPATVLVHLRKDPGGQPASGLWCTRTSHQGALLPLHGCTHRWGLQPTEARKGMLAEAR